jgi:cobalamin synthase
MATQDRSQQDARSKSRNVGIISVLIIAALYALTFVGLNFYIFLVSVVAVWLIANYFLRRIKRQLQQTA